MEEENAGEEELFSHEEEPPHDRSHPDDGGENDARLLAEKSEGDADEVELESCGDQDEEDDSANEENIGVVGDIGQRSGWIQKLNPRQEINGVESQKISEEKSARHRQCIHGDADDSKEEFGALHLGYCTCRGVGMSARGGLPAQTLINQTRALLYHLLPAQAALRSMPAPQHQM